MGALPAAPRGGLGLTGFPPAGILDVGATTAGQPFVAGVLVMWRDMLVVTLNNDWLPERLVGRGWRVGGVGGGQEPGETILDCALREGMEELGVAVDLVHSPVTLAADGLDGELVPVACVDHPAPCHLARVAVTDPARPFKPGLPTGPYLYGATYLARVGVEPRPGDDLAGLLLVPPERWDVLAGEPTLGAVLDAGAHLVGADLVGADLVGADPLPRDGVVWVHPAESLGRVASVLLVDPGVRARLST